MISALGEVTAKIRLKLGESLPSLQKFDVPLENDTTPSLEALRAFSLGNQFFDKGEFASAVPLYQHALSLDPNFAAAYAEVGDDLRKSG